MKNWKITLLMTIGIAFVAIPYIVNFHGGNLSEKTEDWGAFADYMSLSFGLLSIYLIYVTYKEQRSSNMIGRFEERYKTFIQTLNGLIDKEQTLLDEAYNDLCKHFCILDEPCGTVEENRHILTLYYSTIRFDSQPGILNEAMGECFKYLNLFIRKLHQSKNVPEEEKERCMLELSCICSEDVRILFFCWKLFQDDTSLVDYCYKNHFF